MYPGIVQDLLDDFGVPKYLINLLDNDQLLMIANLALDINWKIALPYIPQRYIDEIAGIAEGSGID
jgi:hypothetical protein